jgi:hypothetical protein
MSDPNQPTSYGGGQGYGTDAANNGATSLDTSNMARAVAEAAQAAFNWAKQQQESAKK